MIRVCADCGRRYDDEYRWTVCPHLSKAAAPTLDSVSRDVVAWANATFPQSSLGGKITHLEREVRELREAATTAWSPPPERLAEELADVFMILAHTAAFVGVDLARAVAEKLAICKTRKWGNPDADGIVEHVRD